MRFDAIIILCASAQFYTPWYDYYFMRVSAILCKAIFVIGRLYPDRGGVEATGQTASLLAKAASSLQHHSSIGELKAGNDYFPCFKFCKLLTLRRGRSCAGPQTMFDIF